MKIAICSECSREKQIKGQGRCVACYHRHLYRLRKNSRLGRRCEVPGCGQQHHGHGLCVMHWSRVYKTQRAWGWDRAQALRLDMIRVGVPGGAW